MFQKHPVNIKAKRSRMYKSFTQFILSVQHASTTQSNNNFISHFLAFSKFSNCYIIQTLRIDFTCRIYVQWQIIVRFVVKPRIIGFKGQVIWATFFFQLVAQQCCIASCGCLLPVLSPFVQQIFMLERVDDVSTF